MAQTQSWKVRKSIALVGLMGCGKSAIGKRLANALKIPFYDLDREIENRHKLTVSEIFTAHGEPYFRQQERDVLIELVAKDNCVIATGGGAFINPDIRHALLSSAATIWLKAELGVLLSRVSRKNTRPLLEKGDKRTILKELMDERYPIYQQAEITIESTNAPHSAVLKQILGALEEHHVIEGERP